MVLDSSSRFTLMSMKEKIISVILLVSSALGVPAQTELPGHCSIALPQLLDSYLLKERNIQLLLESPNWGQDKTTNHYWSVYSDRNHNTTYKSPSLEADKYDELTLSEKVRIARIQDGYALVYVEPYTAAIYPKISNEAKSKGWIPMQNLLLWSSCPTDDRGIYHKVLPLVNMEMHRDAKNMGMENVTGKVFGNPKKKDNPQKLKAGMDFYFLMKEDSESGLVLLSKCNTLLGNKSQSLYGWVNKNSFAQWNSRICLEPNWDLEAIEKLKGRNAYIYKDGKAMAFFEFGQTSNNSKEKKWRYRISPSSMRCILLGDNPNDNTQYSIISFVNTDDQFSIEKNLLEKYFSPSQTDALKNSHNQIAFQGFADKKDPQTGLDYWKPVVFISKTEFNDMMCKLEPVVRAAFEGSEDRRLYIDAMKVLVKDMYGDISERQLMSMDSKRIMSLVAGLDVKPELLNGKTLEEIQDNQLVDDEEFSSIIKDFQFKFAKLDRIKNGYDYSVQINGETWYWIPVEDLP